MWAADLILRCRADHTADSGARGVRGKKRSREALGRTVCPAAKRACRGNGQCTTVRYAHAATAPPGAMTGPAWCVGNARIHVREYQGEPCCCMNWKPWPFRVWRDSPEVMMGYTQGNELIKG
jgi:hypothetical protein